MTIYGIKSCGSVKKAFKFFDENSIEYEFVDFKKTTVNREKILQWLAQSDMKTLFNSRSSTYKKHNLKELNLDDDGKLEWLEKENILIKRPVIEFDRKVIVGFDEESYKNIFL